MYLTHEIYKQHIKELDSQYWFEGAKYRWLYMSVAIMWMKELKPTRILEAGTSGIPLNATSYLFEYPAYDLNKFPYINKSGFEFGNKHFDMSVALQVWEHLNNPRESFKELARISKNIILSFPYKWDWGDKRHKGIDDKKIMSWTCGLVPARSTIIMKRNICLWTEEELRQI